VKEDLNSNWHLCAFFVPKRVQRDISLK